jgi:apolipoprotein D and lipocalin family protein
LNLLSLALLNEKYIMKRSLLILFAVMIFTAANSQNEPSVVKSVDLKKYQGLWYEIARLPNFFEKKLNCVTATYTLRDDGKIAVVNAGNNISDPQKRSSSNGVAWVPDKNNPGKLKVQFFWPFSGDYWIMYLDQDYKYVLVGDPDHKYLWILAREKKMDEKTYQMLLQYAINNGYDVKPIIRVAQDCN